MMQATFRISAAVMLLGCLLFLAGCATPVGVKTVTPRESYHIANANPLNSGVLSEQAKFVLNRYFLLRKYAHEPAKAIADLHQKALSDNRHDILYALAEATYLYASQLADSGQWEEQLLGHDYFLLAALYAYQYVLAERSGPPPSLFDSRTRNALDIYSYGLWLGFATGDNDGLVFGSGLRKLPFGSILITHNTSRLPWALENFERFEPADKYIVRGVSVRNRTPGVGLPLVGVKKDSGQCLPLTVFLRLQGGIAALTSGKAAASLEFYSALDSSTVSIDNRIVPLVADTTTPLAYRMEGTDFFGLGLGAFLGKEPNRIPDGLYLKDPYRPGRIPVVLVHGTASSPVWWVELLNTLTADPLVRDKYQFWYFVYTSNKAVAVSAADLRDALSAKVADLDPHHKDPALQQMVVIGHSQGGLLTKFLVVDTGDRLVHAITGKKLADLNMSAKSEAAARRALQVKPLPFVKTVIFFSTPHRGSFQSKTWNRNLVRWLITLPVNLVETSLETFDNMTDDVKKMMGGKRSVFTSADGMSPENPLIRTLAQIPLAPGVKGHSIIAVNTDGDPKDGNDGVVEYKSAHLDGLESELIVSSDHSSQLNPLAIDEVRRILVENPAASPQILLQK